MKRSMPGAVLATLILLTAGLGAPVRAEQMVRFGDLEIHYIAFNTTTLSADMAERYDVPRADNQALVNIAGRRLQADGTTEAAPLQIRGTVTNLLEQMEQLEFREVREPGAVYYLETITFSDREMLRFELEITDPATGRTHPLRFSKELWRQ